jgi:hypothetical protein
MDIECALCGEPWDAYGVRHHLDMTREEARRFLRGEGCPGCRFGEDQERVLPEGNRERFLGSLLDAWEG